MLKVYRCRVPVLDMGGGDLWFPVADVARELQYKTAKMNAMRTLVEPGQLMTIRTSALRCGGPVSVVSLAGVKQWCARVQVRRRLAADSLLRWLSEELPKEMAKTPAVVVAYTDASAECAEKTSRALRTREGREDMLNSLAEQAKELPKEELAVRMAAIYEWKSE